MPRHYFAVIEQDDGPGFSVFFPDLPGCTSAGDTLEEALDGANEALQIHLQGMIEDHEPLPTVTFPPRIDEDVRVKAVVGIPFEVPVQNKRVNIILPNDLLKAIDQVANNRSGFLAEASYDRLVKEYESRGLECPDWIKRRRKNAA